MQIPIQNIYFLLVYAWDKLEESDIVDVASEDFEEYAELFSRVLINGCGILFKRGLDRDYVEMEESIAGIKGKMLVSDSIKANTLTRYHTICNYDNFSYDVLQNQILKFTIHRLLKVKSLPTRLKKELKAICLRFHDVALVDIRPQDFKRVKIHRNNAFYAFLLNICYLIYDSLLPSEQMGEIKFRDFTRDEKKMAYLFEEFVRNFYKRKLPGCKVRSENLEWFLQPVHEAHKHLLPLMKTDISVETPTRKIVIDCKYYKETLVRNYEKDTINPNHLYQITSYLGNVRFRDPRPLEGILLYPVVTKTVDIPLTHGEYDVRICSINLNQDWRQIEEDLLRMIQ